MSDVTGPVDYLVLQLPSERRDGSIATALLQLVDSGIVSILDVALVEKSEDGDVRGIDLNAVAGELQVFAGARSGLLDNGDQDEAAALLDPGTTALVLVYENTWARNFVAAAHDAGAEVLASARIPADVLLAAVDALEN